ncbi:hypothetical protein M0L20_19030 [Spirosoma sp. RP8]|uniref:Uncharacterized protein n=1 Tax=Spirosoma liriopis TaxID=2937440 RepID=A0ABT0HP71_9BACT|nr:hypothetical protein [Spirosoma liriopis]MCK8493968.1 hypothetical protein [Spirosoma liriopis]
MQYAGFIIEEKAIPTCVFHEDSYEQVGTSVAYSINNTRTGLTYGLKHSLESAKKAIDKNGARWLSELPSHQMGQEAPVVA